MDDYIEVNRAAYDSTAAEFQQKKTLRHAGTVQLVQRFLSSLGRQFSRSRYSILELGPGSGYASKLMSEQGHQVDAIEFSEPMAQLAQQTAPKATIITDEFLAHDFGPKKYDGILGVAFLHLFPEKDALLVARKIRELLAPGGITCIATTKHDATSEGYASKSNFQSQEKRFRRNYTRQNLEKLLAAAGFTLVSYAEVADDEVTGKVWMNLVAKAS
jgi:2-polyprenyl-3-methyl-5-hydroxy-6-metoxy-1,4-benzoquinol methylase